MPNPALRAGLAGHASFVVAREHLAINIGSGTVEVLATPMLINGMESAAMNAVAPYLEDDEATVGIFVEVSHNAATPLGMKVEFSAFLTEVSGKTLSYHIEARDEAGKIGEGSHKRVIINKGCFERKAQSRNQGRPK